jgi:ATP-binding cassette subfamily B protein IrtB
VIRTLLSLLPPDSRSRVGLHLALTVVSIALRAVATVLLVPLVAALFSPAPTDAWPWAGWIALVTISGLIVDWFVARIAFELGFAVLDRGQHEVSHRLTRTPLTWFTAENTATARQAIAATGPDLVGIFVYLVTPLLGAIVLPIAIALALLPVAPLLGVAALVGVPVLLGAYLLAVRCNRAADRAAAESNSALTERIIEFARTQHALRSARRVDPARSQVGAALASQHSAVMRMLFMQVPGQLLFSVASQIALILLAGATVWLTATGRIAAPEAIALIVVIARYLEPFTTLAELSGGLETSTVTLRRIRSVLDAPMLAEGEARLHTDAPGRVELRGVDFRYADDAPPVIEGLDLTLEPGTTTAIVGPSGSGKSTILALLAGLYEPTSGEIRFAGTDVTTVRADDRRAHGSAVFQHSYRFDGTIRENVLVGDLGASEGDLAEAARLAQLDSLLGRLPEGWDAGVGEGGANLSGGERQRVAIARALLKRAPLLLIDEATSALDNENEAAVTTALGADSTVGTRVIVAHRLASIRAADRVIFVERGRIVEDGAPGDLIAAGGRFAEFWGEQDAAAGWRLGAATD